MTLLRRSGFRCSIALFALAVVVSASGRVRPTNAEVRERIQREAVALEELAQTKLGRAFLAAADDLPPMGEARTVWYRRADRTAVDPDRYAELPPEEQEGFAEMPVGEPFYYGLYSTPVAYLRALDLAAGAGLRKLDGARVADFGFGNLGQLRMLASLGAHVVGIEADRLHEAVFRMPGDQGPVARAEEAGPGRPGSVTLAFGRYPATRMIRDRVGDGLSLFLSKNTLKRGYIHPERPAPPEQLIDLGVDDETFVLAVFEALEPGGLWLVYNLYPRPGGPDEPYKPWASGACPFEEGLLESVGLEVVALNVDDSEAARAMGRALGWNEGMSEEAFADGFNAMVTILRRPAASAR